MIAERRLHALRQLAAGVARARTTVEVCTIAADTFSHAGADVPFALFYLHGSDETGAQLVASTGLDAYPDARPPVVELTLASARQTWPLGASGEARMSRVTDIRARCGELHGGPYPEPITDAVVVPLRRPGNVTPYGYLVVGISPRRAFDGEYEAFLELAAEHIGAAIANAVAIDYIDGERRRLRSFLLEAPAAVAVFRGSRLVYDLVNDRFLQLVGRRAEELLGKPGSEAIPELEVQPIWKILSDIYTTGEPFRALEFPSNLARNNDGAIELAYFDWLGQATRDAQGVIDGVMLFVVEVTEQVKGRRATDASRKFIEGVVNQMPAGVVIVEAPSGRMVLANALAESLVGRFEITELPLARAIAGELVLEEELTFVQPDGRQRILQVSAAPVYDAERNLVAGVSTFVDISDRRRADEERKVLLERAERARSAAELVGLRVLVVDDEPDAREIVTAVLVQRGAVVTSASSAADALDAVAQEPPDVMLSDIGMPDEDGYALIARIRAMTRARGGATPAACLTGYTTASDRRRALDAGFNMHLAKPIEPSELVAVVANLGRMAKALGDTQGR